MLHAPWSFERLKIIAFVNFFQSHRKEREKGRFLTNTFWMASKRIFDDQLYMKLIEAKPSVMKECNTRNSVALRVDCCGCFDCGWVNSYCDPQRQPQFYSKFRNWIWKFSIFLVFDLIEHKWVCKNNHMFDKTTTTTTISYTTTTDYQQQQQTSTTLPILTSQSTSEKLRISWNG